MGTEINIISEEKLFIKLRLKLLSNLILSILGVSSLYIKFFLVDGVLAFRAFTVDGNLFTALVSVFSLGVTVYEMIKKTELQNEKLFFLKLCSAVTEAVIFIVVMIGYLPVFPDNPAVTPYHMFCLHVAIPLLSVADFILLQRPVGFLKPQKIIRGGIPIAVYGTGVTIAIKTGLLPMALVPYSFLNFEKNFLWYFIFALVVIVSFGYFWSWNFYRLNLKFSPNWYQKEDIDEIQKLREEGRAHYDVVNTSLLMEYALAALVLLMFTLMLVSRTITTVQKTYIDLVGWSQIEVAQRDIASGDWELRDGALYKGNVKIGDGSEENANRDIKLSVADSMWFSFYSRADLLSGDSQTNEWSYCLVTGEMPDGTDPFKETPALEHRILENILNSMGRECSEDREINGQKFFCYYTALDDEEGKLPTVIGCSYVLESDMTRYAKNVELTIDFFFFAIVLLIFGIMFRRSIHWIWALETSLDYLKRVIRDDIPEEPLSMGNVGKRLRSLETSINEIVDQKRTKKSGENPDEKNDGMSSPDT